MFSKKAIEIFNQATRDYKKTAIIDQPFTNKYKIDEEYIESVLYKKAWIDTVQWAYEDIIRDPEIDPVEALSIKRKIDVSNQDRTDTVELLDDYFLKKYSNVKTAKRTAITTV